MSSICFNFSKWISVLLVVVVSVVMPKAARSPLQSPWHQQTVGYKGDTSAVASLLPQAGCSHFKLGCSAANVTCSTGLSVKHCPMVENPQWLNCTDNKWNADFIFGGFFEINLAKIVLWFIQWIIVAATCVEQNDVRSCKTRQMGWRKLNCRGFFSALTSLLLLFWSLCTLLGCHWERPLQIAPRT